MLKPINNMSGFIITKTVSCDTITPVSALLKLEPHSKYLCLLESVTGGENKGRYSVIAILPEKVWKYDDGKVFLSEDEGKKFKKVAAAEPVKSLRNFINDHKIKDLKNLPSISAGVFGYMGYDMIRLFENIPDKNPKNIEMPESVYFVPQVIIMFDNISDKVTFICPVYDGKENDKKLTSQKESLIKKIEGIIFSELPKTKKKNESQVKFTSKLGRKEYCKIVEKSKEYIKAGDIFQIVPSRRFVSNFDLPASSFYRSLRSLNPSPYLFYYKVDDFVIAGSSPEIMVRLRDDKVTIRPIAGTRKRGDDKEHDIALEKDLMDDKKEIAEHLMLLDLGRNDVSKVTRPGSLRITDKMSVERYSHVMHIVSNVEGDIIKGKDALDCLIAGFPAGTVSGAPKIRAMQIIDELEIEKRQFYAGTIGYISANGEMDTAIMLRTALIKDGKIYVQSGGGVVYDSVPENEFEETENKAKALIKAAENAVNYI